MHTGQSAQRRKQAQKDNVYRDSPWREWEKAYSFKQKYDQFLS